MQQILIVNNDIEQCTILKDTINSAFPNWKIETAHCYSDGKLLVKESVQTNNCFTLFLLDKQLSNTQEDHSGFVLAEYIRKNPEYFTTPMLFFANTSDASLYALSKYHCYDFILKPYSPKQILEEIHQMLLIGVLKTEHLEIRDTTRVVYLVPHKDILYFTSDVPHILTIVTKNNSIHTREYTINGLLQKLEFPFVRCHRKFVINKMHLHYVDKCLKHLEVDEYNIPIGQTYLNLF
ncbi:MAG: DNA-binding response regulator [Clostridiales bacterium]|nr:DNA-binding response regulator [Clostridiales bacterium]